MDCVRGYSTAVPYTCPSSSTSSSFFFHHRRARRCRRTYFPQHQHGVFHVLLVLDSINTNVVVQSRTTLPPPLPSPYTLAKPQKPPTHPTIPRGKTYNSIGKNPHKKHRKKTPKTQKKRVGVVWHTMVSNHSPGSFLSMVPSRVETPAVSVLV